MRTLYAKACVWFAVLTGMTETNRPTAHDLAGPSVAPTHPPLSRNRADGIVWYEAMIAQTRTASGDSARFMAGL